MAFTLVEALIAIVIIGVVAGMTLPTLFTTISEKVKNHRIQVFERKLNKGMALLNVENGVGPYYSSTMEFVEVLSKHLKIVNICDSDHLSDCMGYSEFRKKFGTSVNLSDMKNSESLGIYSDSKNDYSSLNVGIVLADGVPMILNYNLKCPVYDPDDVNTQNLSACISGIYDINGSKGPNQRGKDIISFNTSYSEAFRPKPLTYDECIAIKDKYEIPGCCSVAKCRNKDYYAGAAKQCGGTSNMPNTSQLADMATKIFRVKNDNGEYTNFVFPSNTYAYYIKPYQDLEIDDDSSLLKMIGLTPTFRLWEGRKTYSNANIIPFRGFHAHSTTYDTMYRNESSVYAICLE